MAISGADVAGSSPTPGAEELCESSKKDDNLISSICLAGGEGEYVCNVKKL